MIARLGPTPDLAVHAGRLKQLYKLRVQQDVVDDAGQDRDAVPALPTVPDRSVPRLADRVASMDTSVIGRRAADVATIRSLPVAALYQVTVEQNRLKQAAKKATLSMRGGGMSEDQSSIYRAHLGASMSAWRAIDDCAVGRAVTIKGRKCVVHEVLADPRLAPDPRHVLRVLGRSEIYRIEIGQLGIG